MALTIDPRISDSFGRRSALIWLLGANVAVFVALRIVAIVGVFSAGSENIAHTIEYLTLPAYPSEAVTRPWSWITYMFTQYDPSHLIFNMLWLAWFGMLMHRRCGNRVLLAAYFTGGIAGGGAFLIWSVATGAIASGLIGASAAVMSVAVAIAFMAPDMRLNLLFFGWARLKWVAAVMLAIAVICYSGYHPGSDAAHAGGVLAGMIFGISYRLLSRRYNKPQEPTRPLTVATPLPHHNGLTDHELLDSLLDKIRRSGYDSLSVPEKTTLDALSQRLKKS